jgi:hypothetical protein
MTFWIALLDFEMIALCQRTRIQIPVHWSVVVWEKHTNPTSIVKSALTAPNKRMIRQKGR